MCIRKGCSIGIEWGFEFTQSLNIHQKADGNVCQAEVREW